MATVDLTETPVDLIAAATTDIEGTALGLVATTTYVIQAEIPNALGMGGQEQFGGPYVALDARTAIPGVAIRNRAGLKLRHLETARMGGANLWAWTTGKNASIHIFAEL